MMAPLPGLWGPWPGCPPWTRQCGEEVNKAITGSTFCLLVSHIVSFYAMTTSKAFQSLQDITKNTFSHLVPKQTNLGNSYLLQFLEGAKHLLHTLRFSFV